MKKEKRMKINKKLLSLLLTVAMSISLLPAVASPAYAASHTYHIDYGSITISENALDSGYLDITFIASSGASSSSTDTIPVSDDIVITQTNSGTSTTNTITVSSGTANVTLKGVNVSTSSGSAFTIRSDATANLTLSGANTLNTSATDCAGLQVQSRASLTIDKETSDTNDSLTTAGGSRGAGIGSNRYSSVGTITISGGTVTATGGQWGAGIGGGFSGNGATITINGGTVTANGGQGGVAVFGGAGIGSGVGNLGSCTVNISGGTVNATGVTCSAGIGNGYGSISYGSVIVISGGTVTASSENGAGIGGGESAHGGIITISGGKVWAHSDTAMGIGSGLTNRESYVDGVITFLGGTTVISDYLAERSSIYFIGGGSVKVRRDCSGSVMFETADKETVVYETVTSGFPINSSVTCSINGGDEFSSTTDENGCLYLWLPKGEGSVAAACSDGKCYGVSGTIEATNSNTLTVSENYSPVISTESLASGVIGSAYHQTLTTSLAVAPYTWEVTGGALPSGLSLNTATGEISGSPTETGEFNFTVTLTDYGNKTISKALSLAVYGDYSANLTALAVSDGSLAPDFDRDIAAYSVAAESDSFGDTMTITATMEATDSALTIGGQSVVCDASGTGTKTVSLDNGANLIPVTVTSADGLSQKSYILSVNGTVSNTELGSLSIGGDAQTVGASITSYTAEVGSNVTSVAITASPSDSKAIMLLDGVILTSGTEKTVNLSAGENTITLMVVAQDATTKTYTITVNRTTTITNNTTSLPKGCGNGAYLIESDGDAAYTGSYTDDGILALTVNTGYKGFTYFGVAISAVTGHSGTEVCVFVQIRNGVQINLSATKGDLDTLSSASAGFNVKPGDVIKVYIVDSLSNSGGSPVVL